MYLYNYFYRKQRKLRELKNILDLKVYETIPNEFLIALDNTIILELQNNNTRHFIHSQKIYQRKNIRNHKTVTFNNITIYKSGNMIKSTINFDKILEQRLLRQMLYNLPSCDINNKYGILNILTCNPHNWQNTYRLGVTHTSFINECRLLGISVKVITNKLIQIYNKYKQQQRAILNYKSGLKSDYKYRELIYNPYKRVLEWSGRILLKAPNLKKYLLKVVKDNSFSATLIQAILRGYLIRSKNVV